MQEILKPLLWFVDSKRNTVTDSISTLFGTDIRSRQHRDGSAAFLVRSRFASYGSAQIGPTEVRLF
jgi:hypothetical protein